MNKYLQYDSFDFAQEQSFVRWVRKSDIKDIVFWEEWTAKHPEKEEEVTKAISLVNQITFKKEKIGAGVEDKVWSGIKEVIEEVSSTNNQFTKQVTTSKSINNGRLIRLASLAAVAAMAIFFLMVNTQSDFDSTVQTQFADIQSITLPDGSVVQLNSDSKLSYDSKRWGSDRMIELKGEAFFEVKKGSKFTVHTDNGNVKVLGTSFNVYSRAKAFDVYCKTGKVSVTAEKSTTILTPNQAVSIQNQKHNIQKIVKPNENRSNWKEGLYTYTAENVGEVVKELERQLDIKILISETLKKKLYTGSFNTVGIESALSEVFWPLDLKYSIDGNNVAISK